jgi:hypothetical protein
MHNNLNTNWNLRSNMNNAKVSTKLVCGMFATIAIACNLVGCAGAPVREPMAIYDLDTFRVNCKIKKQQVAMLQQMRMSADDMLFAKFRNLTQPWEQFSDGENYYRRIESSSGRTNWLIDQLLMELRECP